MRYGSDYCMLKSFFRVRILAFSCTLRRCFEVDNTEDFTIREISLGSKSPFMLSQELHFGDLILTMVPVRLIVGSL